MQPITGISYLCTSPGRPHRPGGTPAPPRTGRRRGTGTPPCRDLGCWPRPWARDPGGGVRNPRLEGQRGGKPGTATPGKASGGRGRWRGAGSLLSLRPGPRRCGGQRCPTGMRRASAASPGCAADAGPGGGAAALGSGTALRPAHRPPPAAGPSAVSIWDPQQVRGNKARGLVPTEGAGGSPRGRGIVDHIGSTFPSPSDGIEDQVTVTARKGPTRVLGTDVQTWRPLEVAGCFRA